jgi:hypothetical protein
VVTERVKETWTEQADTAKGAVAAAEETVGGAFEAVQRAARNVVGKPR